MQVRPADGRFPRLRVGTTLEENGFVASKDPDTYKDPYTYKESVFV